MAFNPCTGQWGLYPLNPSKPVCSVTTSDAGCNRYARGILRHWGHPEISCTATTFSAQVANAVNDLRVYCGLPSGYQIDNIQYQTPNGPVSTWQVFDYLASLWP